MPSKAGTHLFTLTGIACCSFGLGIIKVKDVIVIEVTLKNIPRTGHIEHEHTKYKNIRYTRETQK